MGTIISRPQCAAFGIVPDCSHSQDADGNFTNIGGLSKGQFQGDADIAGIGIVGAFLAVSGFAMFMSILDIFWQMAKLFGLKSRHSGSATQWRVERKGGPSFSDICETLVLSCSDQQIFTGAAYAVTLRYCK